jgi:hypothetical protein
VKAKIVGWSPGGSKEHELASPCGRTFLISEISPKDKLTAVKSAS